MSHVGVDVERPVGVGDAVDAGGCESVEQHVAVGAVARNVTFELGGRIERPEPAICDTWGAQM